MSKPTERLSEHERAERRRADREFARHAVERLRSSEGWRAWLESRRHFRTYSLHNQLLIAMQCPNATHVAGFRAWLKLGYAVKRGEHAIRIWVPITPSRRQLKRWEDEGSDPSQQPRTSFRLGPVFDRSQVTPLPPPAIPSPVDPPTKEIEGDGFAAVLPRLVALAQEIGSVVQFEVIRGTARGWYELDTKRIVIEKDMTPNAQVRTLIHETAHALLRADRREGDPRLDRAEEELIVESIAYTVCGALGLDTKGYSIPYLASWAQRGDMDSIEHATSLIDRLARRIEAAALDERPAEHDSASAVPTLASKMRQQDIGSGATQPV